MLNITILCISWFVFASIGLNHQLHNSAAKRNVGNLKQEGLAVARIARVDGSSSTNRSSDGCD